jgi:hypothetical protein
MPRRWRLCGGRRSGRIIFFKKEVFLKKRTKKIFIGWRTFGERFAQTNKSFLLLFFKKEALATSTSARIR